MSFLSFYRRSSQIGLDIQADKIRFVEIKKPAKKSSYQIIHLGEYVVTETIFSEGKIKHWEELKIILQKLATQYQWRGVKAALAMPAHLVRSQSIQVPAGLTEGEIEIEVYLHLQRDLPGITDTLCADFMVAAQKNADFLEVYFTAARQEYVSQYVECVNAAGLFVKLVDIETDAVTRAQRGTFYHNDKLINFEQNPHYQLACGLAMREMPLW